MGLNARKPVFRGLRTLQGQTSLCMGSAFVIRFLESFISKLATSKIVHFLASLCSWWDWFESDFVGNPKERFYPYEAHIMQMREQMTKVLTGGLSAKFKCDFQQCGILTSVDSDEPVQPSFKLRNSKWCLVSSLTLIEYSSDYHRLWSDCAYAQADLMLCWLHIPHCWKSHVAAKMVNCL